ncbi:disease resistance protein RGA5-like, partial [Hordeum vulgare subsp. vulgare]
TDNGLVWVYDSIGFGYEDNKEVDNTRKILLYSYHDLPYYPRLCLLHLSIYPEDYEIKKHTLIWKWVAEGYVHEELGKGLFEIGERYFNMLIDRSMIQAVEKPYHSIIYACRVHDLVLDMIHFLSNEKSFVNVLNSNRTLTSPHRLAIQNEVVELDRYVANTSMQHVRSYNATLCRFGMLPLLSNFKALRVLDLEDCTFIGRSCVKPEDSPFHLKHLGRLTHLRYLGLSSQFWLWGPPFIELPKEIGGLKFLQVLDLSRTCILELPQSVGQLTKLKCLRFDGPSMGVLDWTNLTSLEDLRLSRVSSDFLKELGKLTELREFWITFDECDNMVFTDLMGSLGNLKKLQVIYVDQGSRHDKPWSSYEGSMNLGHLRHLILNSPFPGLPVWVNSSCLPKLCHLSMHLQATESHHMDIFGRFSELVTLHIRSLDCIVFPGAMDEDAFPKLRHLHLQYDVQPIFRRGAMPNLEFLRLSIKSWTSDVDFLIMETPYCYRAAAWTFLAWRTSLVLRKLMLTFILSLHWESTCRNQMHR